jgi:PAS domain S-box-containing protein
MESLRQNEAVPRPEMVENRLRLVIDTIPCLIISAQPDGSFDVVNRWWLEFTGFKLDEVQGWGWRAGLASGEPFETEARVRRVDGEYRWFLLRNVPLRDEEGRIVQWYGTGHDTDYLKRAMDRLPLAIDLDYFNQRWLEYLGLSLGDMCGWRWTNVIHPDDVEELVRKWRSSLSTGELFEAESRVRRADGEYRWQFHRKVPLRDQSGKIAKWYGSSIDIEDRRRAEDALRRSEFYLAEGQRPAHVGSWALDSDGFDYWSPELFRMYGLDPARKPPGIQESLNCVHPQDRESIASLIERILTEASPFDTTKRIVRPDGEVRYIRCVSVPIVNNQNLKEYIGSAIDVTEHELLTQELRRREAYMAEAQRLSHTGSFGWRPDCGEIVWSDETYRIFEYDHAVKPTIDLLVQRIHPEDRPDFLKVIERASAGATQFEHTYRWLLPDGSVKHVHALAHVLKDVSGNREFVGAATDVTSIKRAEEELRRSEAELRQILDLTPQLVGVFGPDGERLYANHFVLDYLGVSLEEWLKRSERGEFFHPDDRERVHDYFDRAQSTGSAFEVETRLRKGDGSYQWFLARYNPLRDDKGQITRWYAASTDIDERKRAEEKLQLENAALREEIYQTSMFEEIIGSSAALRRVLVHVAKVAPTDSTVLITGETGIGKELIARAVHKRSHRAGHAFVSVNCAAIPPSLIASELFGYEKGAFTGASQRRLGRFELADGGTLFLDEVGELQPITIVFNVAGVE